MNEELLSNMKFIPESCDLDLGNVKEFTPTSENDAGTAIKKMYHRFKEYDKSNREVSFEGTITDASYDNFFDFIHKNTSIVISRTPWGGTLSMLYEVVKKIYPKKYKEIVIKAERDYLDRLNESEDNTNV